MSRWVLSEAECLECVVMHLTYVIHGRVWVLLVVLATLGFCIAAFVVVSGKHKNRLDSMSSTVSWIERVVLGTGEIGEAL
jgi:hypothetical protein